MLNAHRSHVIFKGLGIKFGPEIRNKDIWVRMPREELPTSLFPDLIARFSGDGVRFPPTCGKVDQI